MMDGIPPNLIKELEDMKITDSMSNATHGYSFLDHPRIKQLSSVGLTSKALTQGWLLPDKHGEPTIWNPRFVERWSEHSAELTELLGIATHKTQGQSRGTESFESMYRNMGDSHRSLFMHIDNVLMTIIGYNKVREK